MEADDLLCSRNAHGLVCLVSRSFWSVWFLWMNFQSDQPNKPNRPDEPAFVGRAHRRPNRLPSKERNKRAAGGLWSQAYPTGVKSMRNRAALVTLRSAPLVDQERTRLFSDSLS